MREEFALCEKMKTRRWQLTIIIDDTMIKYRNNLEIIKYSSMQKKKIIAFMQFYSEMNTSKKKKRCKTYFDCVTEKFFDTLIRDN